MEKQKIFEQIKIFFYQSLPLREISIKNRAYDFFDDIINSKKSDPNKNKDEKLYKIF